MVVLYFIIELGFMNDNNVLYISINQTHECIAIGTEIGFSIYNIDPYKLRYKNHFGEGIGIVEILLKSNIVALVGGGSNPKFPINNLVIWDDNVKKDIIQYQMNSKILNIKLNMNFLLVSTNDNISIYNFHTGNLIREVILPYGNPGGIMALSANINNPFIVYPSPKIGAVLIDKLSYDDHTSIPFSRTLECHNNPIKNINVSSDGNLLVTASVVGTIIKIYDLINFVKLHEFRRGTESVSIQSLEFTLDNKYLILSSNKSTIHIYDLNAHLSSTNNKPTFVRSLMPKYFNSECSTLTISSFDQIKKLPCLIKKGSHSVYHLYLFNHNNVIQIFSIDFNQKQINKIAQDTLCK